MPLYPEKLRGTSARPPATYKPPAGQKPDVREPVYRTLPLPVPPKNVDRPITNMPVDPRGMEQRKMREQEMLMSQIAQRRALENARMGRNF